MAFPETADQAMVVPAMADPAIAEQATTCSAMETEMDLSVEQAFFERATASSDRPVSFDTELAEPSLDLEARELRRVHFTRVVGGIVAALGIGALLALVRAAPRGAEAAPVVAADAAPQEMPEMQLIEPAPTVPLPAPSISVQSAPSTNAQPVRSVGASASSAAPRPRKPIPKAVIAPAPTDVNIVPPPTPFVD
jgi:hypothetical protein